MALAESLLLVFIVIFQAPGLNPAIVEVFSKAEKSQIAVSQSLDGRIKVYDIASSRIQKALQESIRKDQFDAVPDTLKAWTSLLQKSLEDIEANSKSKKKSKKLIKYEIHVRKAINDILEFKLKAPVEQQDIFSSCIAQAEAIRKKFIDIIFKSR